MLFFQILGYFLFYPALKSSPLKKKIRVLLPSTKNTPSIFRKTSQLPMSQHTNSLSLSHNSLSPHTHHQKKPKIICRVTNLAFHAFIVSDTCMILFLSVQMKSGGPKNVCLSAIHEISEFREIGVL